MSYVIIGNSTAAIGAVEGIRKYDDTTPITIISDEPYHTYSRPLISYYLGGKVPEDKMLYRARDFYERNHVNALLGVRVQSIEFSSKRVLLDDGSPVSYEKLLLATGSKPFVPPIEGTGKENVFNFIKFDDVKKIKKVAVKGTKAVVVGASFSGLKAAEALVQRGIEVTAIDIMSRIMPRVLDDTAASIVLKSLEAEGVKVMLNTTVEKILGGTRAEGVLLKNGEQLACDFVILALGVRCNTDIVKDTGIKLNRGIVVDNKMQTSIPDVYAAGDVAEGYNFIEDTRMEIAILPNAYKQGETAGANIAGQNRTFDEGFIMNSMPLLGLPIISAGVSEEKEGIRVKTIFDNVKGSYKKFYFRGSNLVGYLLVDDVDRAGIYTGLIKDRIDVTGFEDNIGSDSFGLVSLPEELRRSMILKGGAA